MHGPQQMPLVDALMRAIEEQGRDVQLCAVAAQELKYRNNKAK